MHIPIKMACIGAGNLTKGLLYPLFNSHGYDVTIIALTDKSVQNLSEGYTFTEIGNSPCTHQFKDISIFNIADIPPDVLSEFEIISTAVGSANVPLLAKELSTKNLHADLQILLCENDIECFRTLRSVIPNVYPTVVDRIVYSESPQSVIAEKYFSFEVFQNAALPLPDFITHSISFEESYLKKRYLVNTLHVITAWYAYVNGFSHINRSLQDILLLKKVRLASEELVQILSHRFPQTPAREFQEYALSSISRFSVPSLNDPVARVGRNALAKLGSEERLMEPIRYARKNSLPYATLLECASYGLLYHSETSQNAHGHSEDIFSYIEMTTGKS